MAHIILTKNDLLRMIKGPIHDLKLLICINLFSSFQHIPTIHPYWETYRSFRLVFFTCPLTSLNVLLIGSPIPSCLSPTCSFLCEIYYLTPLPGQWEVMDFRRKVKIRVFSPLNLCYRQLFWKCFMTSTLPVLSKQILLWLYFHLAASAVPLLSGAIISSHYLSSSRSRIGCNGSSLNCFTFCYLLHLFFQILLSLKFPF